MTQLFAIVETRHSLLYKCTSFSIYYSVYLLLDKFIKTNYSSISWAVISCSTLWLIASPFSNRSFSVVITLPPPSTFQLLKCVHPMNGWIGERKPIPHTRQCTISVSRTRLPKIQCFLTESSEEWTEDEQKLLLFLLLLIKTCFILPKLFRTEGKSCSHLRGCKRCPSFNTLR